MFRFSNVILALTAASIFVSAVSAESKIRVVTATTDLSAIVEEVGRDKVEVKSISKGYQDPHYVDAKPSYMLQVNRADMLVYVGLQIEVGWLPPLVQGARNGKIASGNGNLDASKGIKVLEIPVGELSRAMGDIHPEGNPHYWLDPRNGSTVALRIRERLEILSPDDASYFEGNLQSFKKRLEANIGEWEGRATGFRGKEVVAYHKQWEYLADWLGLNIVDYIEDKPGIPPSPRHVTSLIRLMKERDINVILMANFIDPKGARRVAEETGAQLIILPTSVGGDEKVESYLDLFEYIISQLERAL